MIASNKSDTARYTYRNISQVFKWCTNGYKHLFINVYKCLCLNK